MNPAQRPPHLATKLVHKLLRHGVGRDGVPSALDFKLGGQMLRKHPGLALVGGIGMRVATAIGAGAFAFFNTYMYPDLTVHEGERVVSIINWDSRRTIANPRVLRCCPRRGLRGHGPCHDGGPAPSPAAW